MPTESEKRTAALAVSRYGADRTRVMEVLQAPGRAGNLLDLLVAEELLTAEQADAIRLDLDGTALDPAQAGWQAAAPSRRSEEPTEAMGSNGTRVLQPTASGHYLRRLGEFQLLRRLGQGGMGSVYLGYHDKQNRQVAVKVLADQLASNQVNVDRFYREAKTGARLDHPNIVRCVASGLDQASGKHYLVLEFVDGPSARTLLDRFGSLSVGDAVHIVLDIAHALEHIHARNYVHRDIKPDNILITRSGVAKLGDMGLAKCMDEASHLTAMRQGFGTLQYIPYEQTVNAKEVDGRCDIYALGATLYHLVTGEVPFPGESYMEIAEKKLAGTFRSARSVNPGVPEELNRIINKMMAHEPNERYQTASELIVDLERTGLSAAVPSFTDPDHALQDPVVRARLIAPTHPTETDLNGSANGSAPKGGQEVWYLRYRDGDGNWFKTRATVREVLQRLRDGWHPAILQAAPLAEGEFRPLTAYREFREIMDTQVQVRPRKAQDSLFLDEPASPSVAATVDTKPAATEPELDGQPAAARRPFALPLPALVGLGLGFIGAVAVLVYVILTF